jgi:hypothetical protein
VTSDICHNNNIIYSATVRGKLQYHVSSAFWEKGKLLGGSAVLLVVTERCVGLYS